MSTLEINFALDGTATCLHSDIIPLQSLGHLTVRRASEVEFSEIGQDWCVKVPSQNGLSNTRTLFRSPSRDECIAWERKHWEALL